jgi:hypothetical protein
MTRRYRPPSEPELTQRDQQDLQTCNELLSIIEGMAAAGLMSNLPVGQLNGWLRKRVSFFCAARAQDLVDDDPPVKLSE